MKKNGLLTFVFACIPGAGQMYYGYMLRGLSLITLFCLSLGMSSIIGAFAVLVPIVWMYSFFDTYDLIRHLVEGTSKPDALLMPGNLSSLSDHLPSHNKLIGWVLVGLGGWALYDGVVEPMLANLLYALGIDNAWYIFNRVPTVVVAVLLIWGGIRLLGGRGKNNSADPSDSEIYPYHPTDEGENRS